MQIARSLFIGVVLTVFVAAFLVGIGFTDSTVQQQTTSFTTTTTTTMFVSEKLDNSNISIVKEILIEHVLTNEICVANLENTTVTTTLFSATGNSENSLYVTLSTITISYDSTSTIYENATIISNGSTCTEINPYYNVSTTNSNCECV